MTQMGRRIRALSQDYIDACRTVSETMEAERTGKEQSNWLKTNLKKCCNMYAESMRLAAEYGVDPCARMYFK